jgi:ABC-2 type transport system ATP-binding protein
MLLRGSPSGIRGEPHRGYGELPIPRPQRHATVVRPSQVLTRHDARVSPPAIRIEDLRVVRGGVPVLPGLSCEVATGSVTGLLGPSGSGKSTLMRAVVGVQEIAGGSVEVLGQPGGSPLLRSRLGYMTQAPSVYADLTVRENLAFFVRVAGLPEAAVGRALAEVSLDEHRDQIVSSLSGGERARVSLAAALVGTPELLVLDEPTVGLDPVLRRDLWGLFHRLAAHGATLLVSSHVMDEADRCDALLLLRGGRLLAQATPRELRDRTGENDLDAAFLRLVEATT